MAETPLARAAETVMRAIASAAEDLRLGVARREEGRVVSVGDGVLAFSGLPEVGTGAVVEVGRDVPALVLALERDLALAVVLGDRDRVREGDRVRTRRAKASILAGEPLLGRVVDPLGEPLDGEPLDPGDPALQPMPLERVAPGIHEREAVHTPLNTGILALDAMFPIGLGQRELVLGDDGTGKTALALDVLLRQRDTGVIGVYAAIGHRRAEIWRIVDALRRGGGRWIVVAATHDASPGLRYLAPYAACAVAEHFMERGEHALVIYDDLTAHAAAWREVSLLTRQPPGREAYPGDVFYLHSRLLERATQLSADRGGGSLTALPIAVTESGRLSAYIPTNLISITDGQIVLDAHLFAAGQRPAVDAGLSVSRVGGRAQSHALRALAARMRLDYAAFSELESFSKLGTQLEESTRRRLAVGQRVRELLKAPERQPLSVFDEVVRLLAATDEELLLGVPIGEVGAVALAWTAAARQAQPEVAARVDRDGVLTDEDRRALTEVLWRSVR